IAGVEAPFFALVVGAAAGGAAMVYSAQSEKKMNELIKIVGEPIDSLDQIGWNAGEFVEGKQTFGIPQDAEILSQNTILAGDGGPFAENVSLVKYTLADMPDKIYTVAINDSDFSSADAQLVILHAEYSISDGSTIVFDASGEVLDSFTEADFVDVSTETADGRNLQVDDLGDEAAIERVTALFSESGAEFLPGTIQSYDGLTVANGINAAGDNGVMAVSYTSEASGQSFTALLEAGSTIHQAVRTAVSAYASNAVRNWAIEVPTTTATLVAPNTKNMAVNLLASVASTGAEIVVDAVWSAADYTMRQIADYITGGGEVAEWVGLDPIATPVQTSVSPYVYEATKFNLATKQEIVASGLADIGMRFKQFPPLLRQVGDAPRNEILQPISIIENALQDQTLSQEARDTIITPVLQKLEATALSKVSGIKIAIKGTQNLKAVLERLRDNYSDVVLRNQRGTEMMIPEMAVKLDSIIAEIDENIQELVNYTDLLTTVQTSITENLHGVEPSAMTALAAATVRSAALDLVEFSESHITGGMAASFTDIASTVTEMSRDYFQMFFSGGRPEAVTIDPVRDGYFVSGGAADWLEATLAEQNAEL
ncbi:MAG: hypothetical protein ABJO67_11865, partial [Pseudoruegeria sp.]